MRNHQNEYGYRADDKGGIKLTFGFKIVYCITHDQRESHTAEQGYYLFLCGEYSAVMGVDEGLQPVDLSGGDYIGYSVTEKHKQNEQNGFDLSRNFDKRNNVKEGKAELIYKMKRKNIALDSVLFRNIYCKYLEAGTEGYK